jgi:hypothetical protein
MKSGRQPLTAFRNSFVKIVEMGQPMGRKGLKLKREYIVHVLSRFQKSLQIQSFLVLNG